LGYGVTLAVAAAAGWIVWGEYQHYTDDPWTRDGQVRANVVGIAPRVSGPIIRIAVVDNQDVKQGDLLFEIDPADYHAAVEQAKAQVLAAQAALTQRKQELDRQTALSYELVRPSRLRFRMDLNLRHFTTGSRRSGLTKLPTQTDR
jgi:multidrug resistance efflux pump